MIFLILCIWTTSASAQNHDSNDISIRGYADAYYSWYSNANQVALQQHDAIGAFHNNFGLNIAQVSTAYNGDRIRGVATVHFGDIPLITWQPKYRNIQEANAGIRIFKRFWLDVGFFKTHVGTESFLPKDNLTSIITLATFYGPFYQSGARLSYDTDSDWHFELHAINGYNLHIDDNEFKTFGALVSKKWNDRFFTSYSNMLGQENVGQLQDGYLVYQNAFIHASLKKWDIQIGGDIALANEWRTNDGWLSKPLYNGLVTAKYHLDERFSIAMRGEIFSDALAINSRRIIPIHAESSSLSYPSRYNANAGMTIYGGTISLEYKPNDHGFFRIESRTLFDPDALYTEHPDGFNAEVVGLNPMLTSRTQVMATIAFYFEKTFKFAR
ncbi:MAG: outer membrane beta-barrel protein [Salibacteraceae bacterium]